MASSIVVDLLMRTGAFETDTARAEKRLKQFQRESAQVGKALGTAIAAGGALVVGTFVTMITRGREVIDSQAKMAQQLNTTFESIATLSRAGELAGISLQQVATAGRTLEVNLARGAQGVGVQADALEALGLSAEDLIRLPLDQKIATINRALADNVTATERAAVAADLFGTRNAAAISLLDAGTIAEAARQTEIFGLNLSDVDAAQVEQANDSMGTFGLAVNGASQQITKEFAPLLKAVGDEFLRWSEELGGFEEISARVFDDIVDKAGFVADAFSGIARVVRIVADTIIIELNRPIERFVGLMADLLRTADRFSPFDLSGQVNELQRIADNAEAAIAGARANIDEELLRPLPSAALEQWVRDAQVASKESAEAVVAARETIDEALDMAPRRVTLADVAIGDSDFEAIISGIDETVEGFERAARFVESTRTEVERLEEQIAEVQELAGQGLFAGGRGDEVLERLQERLDAARERLKENTNEDIEEISEFAREAMRGTQNIIADTLSNGFDDGVDGILTSFTRMIDQLVAQALAAQIAEKLFGVDGQGGGFIDSAAGFLGNFFGGGRAFGGPVRGGVTYRVNELEPEFFRPNTSGQVIPLSKMPAGSAGGGVNVQQTINVQGRPDQRTANQIAIEAARRQRVAQARLG